jgi:TRAP-type C4-dicarboxylate transport system permease small subunit
MDIFSNLLERIAKVGAVLGGIFIIGAMLLLVSNILGRFVHFVVPGSYEVFELIMVIPVSFALVYAALHKSHVIVHLITSRFPPKLATAAEILACLVSACIWALIAYASAQIAFENGLIEVSETLDIPYIPFRLLWSFCLILFSLAYVLELCKVVRRSLNK